MKRQNKYDRLIDNLSLEFAKIPNFNLTQKDEKGRVIFNFVVKRIAEIQSFKSLFSQYYLQSASKAVADDLQEIIKSKYRHLLIVSKEDLKENYYETIRLGYVGMFHKYENFIDDLITHAELLAKADDEEQLTPLLKYVHENFGYKIKDWKNSSVINRLNWIANCNKHYDGYPRKTPKHPWYEHYDESLKLKLTKEDFVRDIDFLVSEYHLMLQLVFMFAMHQMVYESSTFTFDEDADEELKGKFEDQKLAYNYKIKDLLEQLKSLG